MIPAGNLRAFVTEVPGMKNSSREEFKLIAFVERDDAGPKGPRGSSFREGRMYVP
jgi:hypothetical protein